MGSQLHSQPRVRHADDTTTERGDIAHASPRPPCRTEGKSPPLASTTGARAGRAAAAEREGAAQATRTPRPAASLSLVALLLLVVVLVLVLSLINGIDVYLAILV